MKKNLKTLILMILSLGTTVVYPSAWAAGDVHFGTIFVEDLEYDNSDDNGYINQLTDSSEKQKELEVLYDDVRSANRQLRSLSGAGRSPASLGGPESPSHKQSLGNEPTANHQQDPSSSSSKIGIVKNAEIEKRINYFIELRNFPGNQSAGIYGAPDRNSKKMYDLKPGEMVKISNSPHQYLHKIRMERENQGLWLKVSNREQDPQNMYVYYDWRNFSTVTPHEMPAEAAIVVPREKNSIPIFSRPGPWTWRDCGLQKNLCVDNLGSHIQAYTFDSTFVAMSQFRASHRPYRLFYKVGYHLKDKDGQVRHKVGWVDSLYIRRKVTKLPKTLLATRGPSSFEYESDEDRIQRLQKYYIFNKNLHSNNRAVSRWVERTPGSTNDLFARKLAIDGLVGGSFFALNQTSLTNGAFEQYGVNVGVGIYAPLFLDLEAQGTFHLMIPLSSSDNDPVFKPTPVFRGEQWLMYTTPLNLGSLPFKFGLGGYYHTMFARDLEFGFESLVGFQAKALLENERMALGFRYGPTGQDLNFRFSNRELGVHASYRLNKERGYESWTLYGDYSDTNFTNPETDFNTEIKVLHLGVSKQF